MVYSHTTRSALGHPSTSPSPLRHTSNASTNSPAYSNYPHQSLLIRASTLTSHASNGYQLAVTGHKRDSSEATIGSVSSLGNRFDSKGSSPATSPTRTPTRSSLSQLPQAPDGSPTRNEKSAYLTHTRSQSTPQIDGSISPTGRPRPHSMAISHSDSVRAPAHDRPSRPNTQHVHFSSHVDKSDLQSLQKSTTGHLRTLGKFAESGDEEDFTITSPEQEVAGLHGRRRLQRAQSTRGKKAVATTGWGGRTWMDQQRQFLQAYEYLCHIGEAKEWIEDVIHKPIPPIVQLEEALRDGVTLAEIVQALYPERSLKIFHNPRLQFRHSDNIALFFRFLADVELPELFRFELVDLYEKKNIPKVIYCIHALSWLLFRKGMVDFRIGNLVGQLQFEDHELEAMQKGLDKAGISMPNFSGMGASFGAEPEPEPEPVESEEDRIDRELTANEAVVLDLQAQIRGAILRVRLGDTMQQLWDTEELLVNLQSRIRGDWTRQVIQYRMDMKRFSTNLQSAVRGFLVRSRQRGEEEYWRDKESQVVTLQSLARARKARANVRNAKFRVQRHEKGIRQLQAAIRGAMKRWDVGDQYYEVQETEPAVVKLQAAIRGALNRRRVDRQHHEIHEAQPVVASLQAAVRGLLSRGRVNKQYAETKNAESQVEILQAAARGMLQRRMRQTERSSLRLFENKVSNLQSVARAMMARIQKVDLLSRLTTTTKWTMLQSTIRGRALRQSFKKLQGQLLVQSPAVATLQAISRGSRSRNQVAYLRAALEEHNPPVLSLQSISRGHLARSRQAVVRKALDEQKPSFITLQAALRGFVQRQRTFELLCELNEHELEAMALQSLARAMLLRKEVGALLAQVENEEDFITELQGLARGKLVRGRFAEKKRFYKENMEKVIKIQSFVRARQQGEAYKVLTSGKNPPVGTVKNFVHLLNDSDFDFDEEMEFERLRKTVVQHVRQNETAEQYIDQLDIKIALLVKNKITLDEVIKHQKHFGGHVGSLLKNKDISSKDPFDLKAMNKNSRKKLEHYQELFFLLQTQPQYLARLFKKVREQGMTEQDGKRIEGLIMGMFGFAQKRREEYYLLKLISRSIKEEVDGCYSLQDYLRGSFFWGKVLSGYVRSPRDRKYLKDLLGPLVKENIVENEALDLESDPMQIYRSLINNEELRTGQRSRRLRDISREEAIRDPETRETFIQHLQDLRDIADYFFASLDDLLHRMPYGIRYIAQQTFQLLSARFPHESQQHLLQIVGHWIWKTYIQPALAAPDTWGVVDRGLSPIHKRNLGEVAKVLSQVAAGKLFGGENIYLQPMNNYVSQAISRLGEIWSNLINVRDAETQFDIDEFNDLYARTKPTLYIKLSDIFAIHQLVVSELPYICPSQDDVLREVIRELGSAKNNENEMVGVSGSEITLHLSPKLHDIEDPDAATKALFMETKRCILYIIRIQSGANLLEIMVRPITLDDEDRWDALVAEELSTHTSKNRRSAYTSDAASTHSPNSATTHLDIAALSYAELKRTALENILALEQVGTLSRHNHYQDLLNAIAHDIRTKHRRRLQRSREMEGVRATLAALDEKSAWLEEQLKSYNDYIEQAMLTLQSKKGKRKFLLPFTRQWDHERELARSGRVPRFGSFKYSARNLADKGVLVSWAGYPEAEWGRLNVTISCDEVGIFGVEGSVGSLMIPGASADVHLDDLLQAQFNNHQYVNIFGGEGGAGAGKGEGGLKLNVDLLVHLIMKKFYRDE